MFATEGEAKRFFIEKIVAQAVGEAAPLSPAQRWMLGFSESDPAFVIDPQLVADRESEISDEDYETKVADLLTRSYERDVVSGAAARSLYREAQARLAEGDHYISLMIDRALGPAPSGGRPGKAIRFVLLVIPGAIGLLIAACLAWGLLVQRAFSPRAATDAAQVAAILAAGGVYLMWLWTRERRP
jgi:hypothetical protein